MNSKKRKINPNSELPLPPELIQLIFTKLPFFNLPSCRLVCKTWNNLILTCKFHPSISISNLFFANIFPCDPNLHCVDVRGMSTVASFSFHSNFPSASISIVNSCNGLVCCYLGHERTKTPPCKAFISKMPPGEAFILNPMTNEYFKPPISDADKGIWQYYFYGFGFSPKTKQYKLARLSFVQDKLATLVEIFTFDTTHKWISLGFLPPHVRMEEHGVYFNGGLYWVGTHLQLPVTKVIYRLDIEEEKFQEISFPHRVCYCCFIGVFNGALCLVLLVLDSVYSVWKMEEDFSWTKAFDIFIPNQYLHQGRPFNLQLIRACEDGNILCLISHIFEFYLVSYNPKTERMKLLTQGQDLKITAFHSIDSFNFDSLRTILA